MTQQDQPKAQQDKKDGQDQPKAGLAGHVGHDGQQPGPTGPGQPVTQPADDGAYDEVAAIDQAHAQAAPGTIEHEQLKVQAESDPEAFLTDPRERNQLAEGRNTKEKAQDLLAGHEQAAKDKSGDRPS